MARFLSIFIVLFAVSSFAKNEKAPILQALKIQASYTLPALEVSGMAWRTNPTSKARELVLVGDRDHKIYLVEWPVKNNQLKFQEFDLDQFLPKTPVTGQSEWESVFSDESGRIFIIQENPSRILVVSADLKTLEGEITLLGQEAGNSGGEGLLPLANGHVLVVKEKNPIQVIEYGPEGSAPQGYKPGLSIEQQGRFPLPESFPTRFKPLHTWELIKSHETLLEDSSGLNVDKKGVLYLLGDQRNMIAKIGKKLEVQSKGLRFEKVWSLPSVLKQPEGMVVDDENRPILAIDTKNTTKPNLFLLSPLK